jgi:hypothetical protein
MKDQGRRLSCHSCGKQIEYPRGEPPCQALGGWLTVSCWEGPGEVSHYNFCSLDCLKSWVDARLPTVPEIFLESFGEDKN